MHMQQGVVEQLVYVLEGWHRIPPMLHEVACANKPSAAGKSVTLLCPASHTYSK